MQKLQDVLFEKLEEKKERMVEIRRYLHMNPELSFQEKNTARYIADFYVGKDCTVRENVGGYGIVVTIDSGKPGRHLAVRGDFDALPIHEETDLPFASKNPGVMHACGHDAHTAYLLILAESLIEIKDQLTGTITILHQPGEETPPGGAIQMIADGCLAGVDNVLGIHVASNLPVGGVFYREGPVQTGRSTFKLKIQGKGGHGAMPHTAIDSVLIGSEFVVAAQSIVSRKVNPFDTAVLTIGSFDGKGSANVIKDSVILEGDVRTMSEDNRQLVKQEFKRVLHGICEANSASYELNYEDDYPVLVNDNEMTDFVVQSLKQASIPEVTEVSRCDILAASEDFAYFAQERPSCFFYVGAAIEGKPYPHHHPKFEIDEDSLVISAKAMGVCVLDYLAAK